MEPDLEEFTLYNLLCHSRAEHHAGIRMLWADPKVQYLVLFAGESSDEKAILTVGPTLDYKSIEEILEVEVDGMIPVAFIKSRHHSRFDSTRKKILDRLSHTGRRGASSRTPFGRADGGTPTPHGKGHDNNDLASNAEESVAQSLDDFGQIATPSSAPSASAQPSASALEKATTDEAWADIKRKEESLENLRQELLAREAFINDSENRLLEISQQHHEKQEELNHKTEQLRKWEMKLEERENRLRQLEASAN